MQQKIININAIAFQCLKSLKGIIKCLESLQIVLHYANHIK